MDRWTREARAQVLQRQRDRAVFRAGTEADPILVQVQARPAYLMVASCQARYEPGTASVSTPLVQFADPVTSVTFSSAGFLAWCTVGSQGPAQTARAYRG